MAKRITYLLGIIILLGSIYLLGVTQGYYQRVTARNFSSVFKQEVGGYGKEVPNFALYETVLDILDDKYYGEIDYLDLLYSSVKGAVISLGDPYTSFSTPAENREFFTSLDGIYEGIGIEIDFIDGRLLVITPVEGSPAGLAGLLPKDEIVAIDGRVALGLDLYEVISLIRGPRGSKVTLIISREGDEELKEIVIIRNIIKIRSVQVDLQDDIAIVKITKFGSDTERLFNRAVDQLIREGVEGIVLDLRNNPGGFLDVGVGVANEFLDGGLIVEEHFKDGSITPFSADGNGRLAHLSVVILVNGGSASAAEIVAGALRDNDRAIIVGERTYGKGSVQEIEEFVDGSALRITVAHWFTPAGVFISKEGINPDIVVKDKEGDSDIQLERAIKELKKIIDLSR